MPIITIDMHPGKTIETKRELVKEITNRTCDVLTCSLDSVEIIINEISKDNWSKSGVLKSETSR
jgi:4-oxalocrotonate tautomerase